ncbi:hypothetical protein [Enterococcus sp. AZ051]|uniref:hypothetical protein n=1 Tax=Enterococcus sp. AZ051 TaxID=2774698 RepID=UPI003D277FC1
MKNKSSYYKILHLTTEEGWLNNPEIVKEVQELGITIPDRRASPMNYKDANGIRVTDYKNDSRKYETIDNCVAKERLCRATITKPIKSRSKAKDGRTFTSNFLFKN